MSLEFPDRVRVVEVLPRDGLQNEREVLPVKLRREVVQRLLAAGASSIEAGSFVRPDRVPQMAGTEEVVEGLSSQGAILQGLVPNLRGYERARAAGLEHVAVVVSALERHSQSNLGAPMEQAMERAQSVVRQAREDGIWVRANISMVWGSASGDVPELSLLRNLTVQLLEAGAQEIALADTSGVAVPSQVARILKGLGDILALEQTALHFHDTRGTALANALVGMDLGVQAFDTATGGLGGCPFAPGATGNLATEDLVVMLDGMGVETGLDLQALLDLAQWIESLLGRPVPSRTLRAFRGPYTKG